MHALNAFAKSSPGRAAPPGWCAAALGLLAFSSVAAVAAPLTLDDYFAAALRRSEVVASQSELIRQAEERHQQAGGALYPTVSGVAAYTWQQEPPPGTPLSQSTLSHQPLTKLTATQPLFRGFREFAALRQSEALMQAQGEDYRHARSLLFKDVAQSFYSILAAERDGANIDAEIRHNEQRLSELQERVRIGRSRVSEVLTVESSVSTLRAQREQLQGTLAAAREAFAFLSGLPADTALADTDAAPEALPPLEPQLAALPQRPDVRATERRLNAAQESVRVARGAHLPSLDLNGNYYLNRPGVLKDITWDVQVALTVPIWSGGVLQSKVREAESQRAQSELGASQVRRQAEQEIRTLHQSLAADLSQVAALANATAAAERNYKAQAGDYRLGLVTNLEVLQALAAYLQNQRAHDRARYTALLDAARLQAATATHPLLRSESGP